MHDNHLLAQNGFAPSRSSRRCGDDVERLVEGVRRHLLDPPCTAGARLDAAQSMDLDGAERLRADTHEDAEKIACSLDRDLTLGEGADPHDTTCLVLIRVEVQLQKPLSRRETTSGNPQERGWR